jgi:hypothetical protein
MNIHMIIIGLCVIGYFTTSLFAHKFFDISYEFQGIEWVCSLILWLGVALFLNGFFL